MLSEGRNTYYFFFNGVTMIADIFTIYRKKYPITMDWVMIRKRPNDLYNLTSTKRFRR